MRYEQVGNTVVLSDYDSFDIAQTLECGQCFRFERLEGADPLYRIVAFSKVLNIRQSDGKTFFYPCTAEEFEQVWRGYFDLDRDYRLIKETLSANDFVMRDAVECAGGIRILRQDPWECLISFIISQNNNIKRICGITNTLSRTFGEPLGDGYFSFPTSERMAHVTLDDIIRCKTGFRAKYILDAAQKVYSGEVNLGLLADMPSDEACEILKSIKGVGAKIADCVLLFAYARSEVFPTDVWIKRVMQHFYFKGENASMGEIHGLAHDRFGEYAGFAQEYLYVYAREYVKF